jgi:thiamine pyrophosphate-dependent acetolactate synthase large subunit-like protein
MTQTTAETLVDRLRQWGVDTIFGFAGDGIGEILEVLRRDGGGMRFITVRHEESAACTACAYGKLTGRLGVCMATSAPSGAHLVNGLYDQAISLAKALAKGPPDRFTIMRGGVAATARELRDAPGTLF